MPLQARRKLGRNAAEAVWEAMQGWSRWAVGLQWLLAAADSVGLQANGEAVGEQGGAGKALGRCRVGAARQGAIHTKRTPPPGYEQGCRNAPACAQRTPKPT